MAFSQQQLSNSIKGLKRVPAPKVPGASSGGPVQAGPIDLNAIKLRKTGKRESLIEEDFMAFNHEKENSQNEHNFKNRLAKFEHQENAPEKHSSMPRVMPKPKYRKTSEGSEDEKDVTKSRSQSFPRSKGTTDDNSNIVPGTGIPTMKPLPSLQSIGKIPPPKPTKPLILVMKVQKRYKNHKVIIAPKVEPLAETVENGRDEDDSIEEGEDIYDDICSAEETRQVPHRPQPKLPTEPEPIEEEMYDDVEQLAETVKAELKGEGAPQHLNTSTSDVEPMSDDFYDDCNSSQPPPFGGMTSVNDEEGGFGEDLYEGVDVIDSEPANGIEENEDEKMKQEKIQPSAIRPSNKEDDLKKREKEKKEKEKKEKELQKKKEKEEQRRKKEEEKQERERKKKEEEERRRREKFDKELKKVHKLKGNEDIITKGTAKEDFAGTGKEIPCAKGTVLEVILKENCPSGKWLIRNPQGHLGYVPSTILEIAAEESEEMLDEDLYECVDTFKSQDPPPQPPVSSIPPSNPVDGQEDIYDDTVIEDEDLYDDIPGA